MTERPPVNGQVIGEAERAILPLLQIVLGEVETSFETWVTLNAIASAEEPAREALLRNLAEGLGGDPAERLRRVEAAGLVREAPDGGPSRVELTPQGQDLHGRIREGIARTNARLYAGMDADDLATTREVLVEVTRRARALAGSV